MLLVCLVRGVISIPLCTHKQTDRQTDRLRDRQIDKLKDRQLAIVDLTMIYLYDLTFTHPLSLVCIVRGVMSLLMYAQTDRQIN